MICACQRNYNKHCVIVINDVIINRHVIFQLFAVGDVTVVSSLFHCLIIANDVTISRNFSIIHYCNVSS